MLHPDPSPLISRYATMSATCPILPCYPSLSCYTTTSTTLFHPAPSPLALMLHWHHHSHNLPYASSSPITPCSHAMPPRL
eukprot:3592023-Rhodomonas_salina.1